MFLLVAIASHRKTVREEVELGCDRYFLATLALFICLPIVSVGVLAGEGHFGYGLILPICFIRVSYKDSKPLIWGDTAPICLITFLTVVIVLTNIAYAYLRGNTNANIITGSKVVPYDDRASSIPEGDELQLQSLPKPNGGSSEVVKPASASKSTSSLSSNSISISAAPGEHSNPTLLQITSLSVIFLIMILFVYLIGVACEVTAIQENKSAYARDSLIDWTLCIFQNWDGENDAELEAICGVQPVEYPREASILVYILVVCGNSIIITAW
jgi:hypothetical protein